MCNKICDICAVRATKLCPYTIINNEIVQSCTIPEVVTQYGCYRYTKLLPIFNKKGNPTYCRECRFLFKKSAEEVDNKSYIMCGCVSSLVQKIEPVSNCPNFKPLRKKVKERISDKVNRYRGK